MRVSKRRIAGKPALSGGIRKTLKWGRHNSSDSNAKGNKFRRMAHVEIRKTIKGESESVIGKDTVARQRLVSELSDGKASVISQVTGCTLPTFRNAFLSKPSSITQSSVLAVLGAVTEVVRANGGKETDIEYFAAFLTTLETVDNSDVETIEAVLYLSYLACKRLPTAVLQNKFLQINRILDHHLFETASEERPVSRYGLAFLSHLLSNQPESVWADSVETRKSFQKLLSLAVLSESPGRNHAEKGVKNVLEHDRKIAAGECSLFIEQMLASCDLSSSAPLILNVLGCLQAVCFHLPMRRLKSISETLFSLLAIKRKTITLAVLQIFHSLFLHRPKEAVVPKSMNIQLLSALYEVSSLLSEKDRDSNSAWANAIGEATIALYYKDKIEFAQRVLKCIQTLLERLYSTGQSSADTIFKIAEKVIEHVCSLPSDSDCPAVDANLCVNQVLCSFIRCFSEPFVENWSGVFALLAKFFASLKVCCFDDNTLKTCLVSLAEFRENLAFCQQELDDVFSAAVSLIGPEAMMKALPCSINMPLVASSSGQIVEVPRSWLLPVLRVSTKNPRASFFFEYFLPLATSLAEYRKRSSQKGQQLVSPAEKTLIVLETQVWELLPVFLNKPVDLAEAMQSGLGKAIASLLNDRADLRLIMLRSLRVLFNENATDEVNRLLLSRYAANYCPILFSLFANGDDAKTCAVDSCAIGSLFSGYDPKAVRLSVMETIRSVVSLLTSDCIHKYVRMILDKLQEVSSTSQPKRLRILELLAVLTKKLSSTEMLEIVFQKVILHYLGQAAEAHLQKKALRILESICSNESDICRRFTSSKQSDIKALLFNNNSAVSSSAKAFRMKCLGTLLGTNLFSGAEFLNCLLPDIAKCLREPCNRTRRVAAQTLTQTVRVFTAKAETDGFTVDAVFTRLLEMCVPGYSVDEVTAALIGCRLLIFDLKAEIESRTIVNVLQRILAFMSDARRPIVKSSLELIATLISAYPRTQLELLLEEIVPMLFRQTQDIQRHYRFLTGKVLKKLVKKFDGTVIIKYVPASHHKQLTNIQKQVRREAQKNKEGTKRLRRKGTECEANSFDDDENDDALTTKSYVSTAKTWRSLATERTMANLLRDSDEDNDDDDLREDSRIRKGSRKRTARELGSLKEDLDSMDLTMAACTLRHRSDATAKPGKDASASATRGFPVSADGRLIITEGKVGDDDSDSDIVSNADSLLGEGPSQKLQKTSTAASIRSVGKSSGRGSTTSRRKPLKAETSGKNGLSHRDQEAKSKKGAKTKSNVSEKMSKGRKAGGQGPKMEPYSYIPLKLAAQLSHRKKLKSKVR